MTRVRQALWWLAAPLLSAALYWRAFLTWFQNDDFAWLGLPLEVHRFGDLWSPLFRPAAQGTVRVLSERVFFLVFSSVFGYHALPYRLWIFATWFAALTLASLIATRLTGSRTAGLLAALLWAANPNLVRPLAWASSYNQILCAFLLLAAFYARLRWLESGERKWAIAEWVAYLAGFGALEVMVVYPALVLLYHACLARARWRSALALIVPAAVFSAVHAFVIPKPAIEAYHVAVDSRMAGTFVKYAAWSVGPCRLGGLVDEDWRSAGYVGTLLIALGLAAFLATRWRRREYAALFCLGWFAIAIAPVLPLHNHLSDYYVTLPSLAVAWLGGWAMVAAWRSGVALRVAAILLAAIYLAGSYLEIDAVTEWFQARSTRMHTLFSGTEEALRLHPGSMLVFTGVDTGLFEAGFHDDPFHLLGASRVYLAPGSESALQGMANREYIQRFTTTTDAVVQALDRGEARVLSVTPNQTFDVTDRYGVIARAEYMAHHRNRVDVGSPAFAAQLGPTWHPIENGFRWMPKTATLQIAGPKSADEKLYVTGFAAAPALAAGPLTLRFQAGGQPIGSATVERAGERFELSFPLPGNLVGQYFIEIAIEVSRTFHAPNDPRELGIIFGTFEVR